MPKVGRIDVPETLWEAMVERIAKSSASIALGQAIEKAGIKHEELAETFQILEQPAHGLVTPHFHNCIVALLRIQTNDFVSDDDAIIGSDDFSRVCHEAGREGYQRTHYARSSDNQIEAIKTLAANSWKDMGKGFSSSTP